MPRRGDERTSVIARADDLPDIRGRWGEDDESGTLNRSPTRSGQGPRRAGRVLLDLAADGPLPGGPVTGRDLDAAEEREGVTLESGDVPVLRGGRNLTDDPPVMRCPLTRPSPTSAHASFTQTTSETHPAGHGRLTHPSTDRPRAGHIRGVARGHARGRRHLRAVVSHASQRPRSRELGGWSAGSAAREARSLI